MTLADLQHEIEGAIVYAKVSGEIDMSNAQALREGLVDMTANEARGLILDLSDVDYVDSAGIHLIYRLRESLQRRGQRLRLVIPERSFVNDALRLAGIERGEEIVTTAEAAREALERD